MGFIAHLFVEWLRTGLAADLYWGVPHHDAPGDFRKRQPPPQTAKMKFFAIASGSSRRSPLRAGLGCSPKREQDEGEYEEEQELRISPLDSSLIEKGTYLVCRFTSAVDEEYAVQRHVILCVNISLCCCY